MIRRKLLIGRWEITFMFADNGYDMEDILTCLYDMEAPYSVMMRVYRIMKKSALNYGFTYPNKDTMEILCVVGPTSSGKEFLNTLVHELRHVVNVIAESLGYDLESEKPAYMSGDLALELAESICSLGCEHCRNSL